MRRNPSTVVVLAGPAPEELLAAVSRLMNVSLVRPGGEDDPVEAAAGALRRAAGISSAYVIVPADPLAPLAAGWEAMWDVSRQDRDPAGFEKEAAGVLAAWRAGGFELPDYYLAQGVPARPGRDAGPGGESAPPRPGFHLGPLRSLRPHRVAVFAAGEPAEQAASVAAALGSLPHGPWWPPLAEVIDAVRRFYPGSVSQAPGGPAVPLLA